MSVRALVVTVACLAALVLAWDKREALQGWVGAAQALGAPSAAPLRKCVNGQQVSYTNAECPTGHKEQAVAAPPVNVLPATPVPKADRSAQAAQAGSAPLLQQALDVKQDATLKDKMMERAIDGVR
jgi:hypothetical protein